MPSIDKALDRRRTVPKRQQKVVDRHKLLPKFLTKYNSLKEQAKRNISPNRRRARIMHITAKRLGLKPIQPWTLEALRILYARKAISEEEYETAKTRLLLLGEWND